MMNATDPMAMDERTEMPGGEADALREKVVDALKLVYDPEIPVNIYDLGLVYDIEISADRSVAITMTLTAPGCPVAETMPGMVETAVQQVEEIKDVSVHLTWEPPWTQDRMTDEARLALNMF